MGQRLAVDFLRQVRRPQLFQYLANALCQLTPHASVVDEAVSRFTSYKARYLFQKVRAFFQCDNGPTTKMEAGRSAGNPGTAF